MKTQLTCFIACAVVATAFAPRALANEGDAKAASQHSRFAACAHESKGLRGDDHQNFMSECLKGNTEAAAEIRKDGTQHAAAEARGLQFVATNPAFGPMYDLLYSHYRSGGRARDAEEILKLKIQHNPGVPFYVLQLAEKAHSPKPPSPNDLYLH